MSKISQSCGICAVVLMLISFVAVQVGATISPLEQVRTTVTGIIGVMQSKEMAKPDNKNLRRQKIIAFVDQRFDFEEMSKQTLAVKWRELSPEQRKNFERLFADLLKNTYIGRVEAYSDEAIIFDKEVFDGDQKTRAIVYTKVVKNNLDIPINYKVIARNGEWFVYDVMIEGVSLIRNYRTEFARVLNQERYDGLMKRLQDKIDNRESAKN